MIRLSLTGKQLAELYVLNAMGVPSNYYDLIESDEISSPNEYSFLVDTYGGRNLLISYASDLYDNIKNKNDVRIDNYIDEYVSSDNFSAFDFIPLDSVLDTMVLSYLEEQIDSYLPEIFKISYINNEKKDKNQLKFNFAMVRISDDFSTLGNVRDYDELDDKIVMLSDEIDDDLSDYSTVNYGDIIYNLWDDSKKQNRDLLDQINIFIVNLKKLFLKNDFKRTYWEYYYNDNIDDFQDNRNRDEILAEIYDPEDVHFAADDILKELSEAIEAALGSNRRDDYLRIIGIIDSISSMSHHGGPLFEYGDTTLEGSKNPNLIEIMNRKFGDRFIGYVLSNNLLPDKYKKPLQDWYDERVERESQDAYFRDMQGENSRETERNLLRDDYYHHPYYSNRSEWESQNSPTYNEWTPYSADYEDYKNVESVGDVIDYENNRNRGGLLRSFYNVNKSDPIDKPDRSKLKIASLLLKISGDIDNMSSDMSDSIEKVVLSHVV